MHVESTISDTKMQEQAGIANTLFKKGRFREALEKYLLVAEAGSIEAQLLVGWIYQVGRGVEKNLNESHYWFLKAIESNAPEAQFYLGRLYEQERKYQEAINCFRKSAMQNYLPSIYQMGTMYALGKGVVRNKEEAYKHYEQAANLGHLMAQREVGIMMVKGHRGVKKIPQGILTLMRIPYKVVRLALKNIEDDRLRW